MNFPQITHRIVKLSFALSMRDLKSENVLFVGTYKECQKYAENDQEHGCLAMIPMEDMDYSFPRSTNFIDN